MELEDQTAIVTGAGRGIGRSIALELASMGAAVAVVDLDAETAGRTADDVEGVGRASVAVTADISREADRRAMVQCVVDRFGRIDILVNNAGINRRGAPLDVTEEVWDATMNVNARGTFFCTQLVLPYMVAAGRGVVVSIASQSGKLATPMGVVYGVSKAAIISMTRSLAVAFAADGIRVNCVCPGSIWTDMWAKVDQEVGVVEMGLRPGEYRDRRAGQIPLGRLGDPDDVARVVGFLASSKSAYMTGQAINVTGGAVMF